MKRTERQHLKENELRAFALQARDAIDSRRRETTAIVTVGVIVAVLAVGYFAWRERVQSKAHGLLAQAMTVQDARIGPPPAPGTPSNGLYFPTERERAQAALTKFKIAADAYPSTDAGIYARYQQASTALALGDAKGAMAAYQDVIGKTGDSFYGQMAKLGLAEELRVNRNTVAKAYAELESQGVIETVAGKGCFVRANKTPFRKEVRVELLAHEIDEAVIQAHHLQVGKADFLRLAEARFDAFQHQRDRAQG